MAKSLPVTPVDNNRHPLRDNALLIAMGCFPGISHVNKFGSIVDAATDTVVDVWDGGGTYIFPATALMTHISQTTDQVAARGASVTIEGLDANYAEVSQTKTLNATLSTTPVAIDTPLMRVNRMYITTAVVLTSTVRLHNAGETVDYVDIQIDHNQTLNAIYTVPAGKTAFLIRIAADHVPISGKDPRSVHFHIYQRQENQGWRIIESFGVVQDGAAYDRELTPYVALPEKTDIRVNAKSNGSAAHIHASFDLILADNEIHNL